MAFVQTLLLAVLCLFCISGFVQDANARDVQLRSTGRTLAQRPVVPSDAVPDDGNEGEEGNEGNEGSGEGDEGSDGQTMPPPANGDQPMTPPTDGGDMSMTPPTDGGDESMPPPTDGGDEPMPPPPNGEQPMTPPTDGGDEPMPPPADEGMPEDMPATPVVATAEPVEGQEGEMAPEPAVDEAPVPVPEEAEVPEPEAVVPEEEEIAIAPEEDVALVPEDDAMAPIITPGDALAPGPVGTRDFDIGATDLPAQCSTLRDGLTNVSPVLQTALDAIAPAGDPSTLAQALDNPNLNVTVLLPTEDILQRVATAFTQDTTGTITSETVQEILLNHIIPAPYEAAELIEIGDGELELLSENIAELMIDGSTVVFTVGNTTAEVVEADLDGCAGESVIHRINEIFTDIELPEAGTTAGSRDGATPLAPPPENSAPFVSVVAPAAFSAVAAFMMLL